MAAKGTDIADFGAVKLLDRISTAFPISQPSTVSGIGNDAAVINNSGKQTVAAAQLMLEGIHFDLTYTPLKHLGYKAVIAVINKIYAMNAAPVQLLLSLGVSQRFTVEDIDEITEGIAAACKRYQLDLAGVDISSSFTGLTVGITAVGAAEADQIVTRSGGKPTDLLCLSGNLGAAYMGLQLLRREKTVFEANNNAQPQLEGYNYILQRYLKPEAQQETFNLLTNNNIVPTAMISAVNGLASDTLQICKASNCGVRIYLERLPIASETFRMAEEMNFDAVTAALNGGDDYELLFTVPLGMHEIIQKELQGVDIIGHLCDAAEGNYLITPDNQAVELKAQGWE
ncbi:MAG: thiamine-phosphate kinase [Bacteroidales bacterium]|nr:thiamine-phosphate kinase [Bacteroidales bacterium]MCL2133173.1 thiamine-phosphate kinase [Bacteroidales bacterium]